MNAATAAPASSAVDPRAGRDAGVGARGECARAGYGAGDCDDRARGVHLRDGVLGEVRDGASATYALMLKSRLLGENPCDIDRLFRRIKQFGGIVTIDRTTVENAHIRRRIPETPRQRAADRSVHRRNVAHGRHKTGADRPDRFIGHDQTGGIHVFQALLELHLPVTIVTDDELQTSRPGLYAIGDEATDLNQISVAFGHAAIAATAIHRRLDPILR